MAGPRQEDQTEDEAVRKNKLMGVSLSGLRSTHQRAGGGEVRGQRARPLPAVRYLAIRHSAVLSFSSSSLMALYVHRNHKAYKWWGRGGGGQRKEWWEGDGSILIERERERELELELKNFILQGL